LYDNIRFLAGSDEMDSSSFLMFLSEIMMLTEDMIKYFYENIHGGVEVWYKVRVGEDSKLQR